MQKKSSVLRLTESAVMVALATVLSEIKITNLPFGGSVTAFSMLPLAVIAYRYGTKWGLFTGCVYGLLQMMLGMQNLRYGADFLSVTCIILFDYLLAFGVLGVAGCLRKQVKHQGFSMACGALLGLVLRYACHFISGWTVWAVWAPEGMPAWKYSLSYNATYMVPETIITVLGAFLICSILDFSNRDITRRFRQTDRIKRNQTAFMTKFLGVAVMVGGVLYDLFAALSVLFTESSADSTSSTQLLTILAGSILVGGLLYAVGEIVQILSDLRDNTAPDQQK